MWPGLPPAARIDALALELVQQGEHVGGGHHDDLGAEVLDDLHLAGGHAAGGRDHRAARALRAVVRAQPAGEQPVAVGDVHLVPGAAARRPDRPGHHVGPHVQVLLGVADHGRPPGRAAGGVQPAHLVHRHREHPERVAVAQVGLGGEREPGQVGQAAAVLRADAGRVELPAVQLHLLVGVAQGRPQTGQLVGPQLGPVHPLARVQQVGRQRLPQARRRFGGGDDGGDDGGRGVGLDAHGFSSMVRGARRFPTVRLRPRNSAITSSPRRTVTS